MNVLIGYNFKNDKGFKLNKSTTCKYDHIDQTNIENTYTVIDTFIKCFIRIRYFNLQELN